MLISKQQFEANFKLDVSRYIETKGNGKFNAKYISWASAQMLLKTHHPDLSVDFEKKDGNPIFAHGDQSYVLAFLTDGEKRTPSVFYPVWDNQFKPISDASVWDANNSFQRATAKVIALETGLGLCCYVGEDLDGVSPQPRQDTPPPTAAPTESFAGDWKAVSVPNTKHKGKTLGELPEGSQRWFIREWQPWRGTDGTFEPSRDHILFREAIDEMAAELDGKPVEEKPTATNEEPAEEDDEDVPF